MLGLRSHRFETLVLALLSLSFGTFACAPSPDPQKTFDSARQTFIRGNYPKAKSEAQSGYQRFLSHDQMWAWKFRFLEAEILVNQGQSADAGALLLPSLPPQLSQNEISIKQEILQGNLYVFLGRFPEAAEKLRLAEALCEATHSSLAGEIAQARGVLELARSDLENAARLFRKSIELAQQQQDSYLETTNLLNLGVLAMRQQHFDQSIEWSGTAQRMSELHGYLQIAQVATGNLAWDYYKMGDFDRSLILGRQAEQRARELDAVGHQILWLNNIGLVYYQMNQLSTAEEYYRQSLALAEKHKTPGPIIDALTSIAFVSVQKGQLQEAQQYSEQAFQKAHSRNDRASELYPLLVRGQVAAGRGEDKQAEAVFHEVASDPKNDLSLRWEAQNDLARLYEQEHRLTAADKQYREALATIEQARDSLQHEEFQLPFLANAAHLYDDYIRFLLAQGKDRRALQLADYSRARTLAEGLGVLSKKAPVDATALNPQQIARDAHATVLFYWLGRECSYLWAITANRTTRYQLPPSAEIDAAVQRYRRALLGWQDVLKTANADGNYLYNVLVAPAQKLIAPNSRVILITDGSLDNLNFETLLTPGPSAHYWIENATVLSASSLRVLAASQSHQEHGNGKLLLIGDANAASPEYAPLPNAVLEMENVENHFPAGARHTYSRDRATPAAYLGSDPEQFSFIHFVAHATASKLSPLDSAIVLSRASPEQDSFKLYARDITSHSLHADLVTISSCYGAGAEAYSGEGLVGLSWAFLRAGAHNVIGALWDVSDASTANLMGRLYDGLKRGQPPDAALRSAKLSLLHSDEVVRKPFYWAPFQLYTGR